MPWLSSWNAGVFENAHDLQCLAIVLNSLAQVEHERGYGDVAIGLERDALRYFYAARDAMGAARVHENLGAEFSRRRQPGHALVHWLAVALIWALAGADGVKTAITWAANSLRTLGGDGAAMPIDLPDLGNRLADLVGADLQPLVRTLASDPAAAQEVFQELLTSTYEYALQIARLSSSLATWEPFMAAILAANSGNEQAAAILDAALARQKDSGQWTALVATLQRLRTGETGPGLLDGLDKWDAAIAKHALDVCVGTTALPAELWPAMSISPLLGHLVQAAAGSAEAAEKSRQFLNDMAETPGLVPLVTVLDRILNGDRDPELVSQFSEPVYSAVVETVLHHISGTSI